MSDIDDLDAVRTIVSTLEKFERQEQERILRWSMEKLGISIAPATQVEKSAAQPIPTKIGEAEHHVTHHHTPHHKAQDIKSFVTNKNPSSDNQFAATIAYYYQFEAPEEEKKESVTAEDVQEACRKVGRTRLGDPGKTLRNAHGMGYLDKADRGTYRINTVGENLVAVTLPSSGGNGAAKTTPRKRKVTAKKAKPKAKK